MQKLLNCLRDERGATVIEYGLIAALISIVAIAAMQILGVNVSNVFSTIASNLSSADR